MCAWLGRWDFPGRGCDRWAAHDVPIDVGREIHPEPELKTASTGTRRRRR